MDNLSLDIEHQLLQEGNKKYGNVRNAVQRALNVGQSLGILTLTNEVIKVPFNFRAQGKNARAAPDALNLVNALSVSQTPNTLIEINKQHDGGYENNKTTLAKNAKAVTPIPMPTRSSDKRQVKEVPSDFIFGSSPSAKKVM